MENTTESQQPPAPTSNPQLLGRFYIDYDVPLILLWLFIFIAGCGNWLAFWTFLKTKKIRTLFNLSALSLCFSNGLMTTMVSPMELWRIVTAYPAVSLRWCRVRVFLTTFSCIVSITIIFMLSAMRLGAGLAGQANKITKIIVPICVVAIGALAMAGASLVMLDGRSGSMQSCMAEVPSVARFTKGPINIEESMSDDGDFQTTPFAVTEMTSSQNMLDSTSYPHPTNDDTIPPAATPILSPRAYFLILTGVLLVVAVIFYLCLLILIKKKENILERMTLGDDMDILTLEVMAYVTGTFFVSFLLSLFPEGIYIQHQRSMDYMHYINIFQSLYCMSSALNPIYCYFFTETYRKALQKAMPYGIRKYFCISSVTPDMDNHTNGIHLPE